MKSTKWCIKVTKENKSELDTFLHTHSKEYQGYNNNWNCQDMYYLHYPQATVDIHSHGKIQKGYTEISNLNLKVDYEIF